MTTDTLSKSTQNYLMLVAKHSIFHYLRTQQVPTVNTIVEQLDTCNDPILLDSRAAFVTLKLNNKLRGCIGSVTPNRSLISEIIHQSINAAFNDYRFMPLTETELDIISFEISVLSPPYQITNVNEINIQKHGIILKRIKNPHYIYPK